MKNIIFILTGSLFLIGCSGTEDGVNGKNGSGCTVQQAINGALVLCTDGTSALITNGSDGAKGDTGNAGVDGQNGTNGQDGATGATGSTGATGATGVAGMPGMNGRNGVDAITEIINPCNDNPGQFDEILLRLATGELLAYFESGSNRFLSLISPGNYQTTDSQHCHFTVNSNGSVTW